jgi:orotate phosphoribosyltransferase
MIQAAGATPCGVAIALDRQEKATHEGQDTPWSATQYVTRELGLPVACVASLHDLLLYLQGSAAPEMTTHLGPVRAYRERYGV